MLILVFVIVVHEALFVTVLECTNLVGHINRIFGIITHIIKTLHGICFLVFKNMCFWCDTKSKLVTYLRGGKKKAFAYLVLSQVGSTFRN